MSEFGLYYDQPDVFPSTSFGSETMGYQIVANFDTLPASSQIQLNFSAKMQAIDGLSQGTMRIRLDGTLSGVDGTILLERTYTCVGSTSISDQVVIPRPTGPHLLKFTEQVAGGASAYQITNFVFAARAYGS